jgi:hypothetical protein
MPKFTYAHCNHKPTHHNHYHHDSADECYVCTKTSHNCARPFIRVVGLGKVDLHGISKHVFLNRSAEWMTLSDLKTALKEAYLPNGLYWISTVSNIHFTCVELYDPDCNAAHNGRKLPIPDVKFKKVG